MPNNNCSECLTSEFYQNKALALSTTFGIPITIGMPIVKSFYYLMNLCGIDCCEGFDCNESDSSNLQIQDEGTNLGDNLVDTINFIGGGVTASRASGSNTVTVYIPSGSSSVYTASNLGSGKSVYKEKIGNDFKFRTLLESGAIELSSNNSTITIHTDILYDEILQGSLIDDLELLSGNEVFPIANTNDGILHTLNINGLVQYIIDNIVISNGDNWGTQVVIHDETLTGNGTIANPLSVIFPVFPTGSSGNEFWKILGNNNIDESINFLGTTTDKDLIFKRNNINAGLINDSNKNTFFGSQTTINSSSLSTNNTGIGYKSLYSTIATGNFNTSVGSESLENNTTGQGNSSIGAFSLKNNTTGNSNTSFGYFSSYDNIDGDYNTALGSNAFYNNTSGDNNTAIGHLALYNNVSNSGNTAIGAKALQNANSGNLNLLSLNTAVGYSSLVGGNSPLVNTGINNTAIGAYSLTNNVSGSSNQSLGNYVLHDNTFGSSNIGIGHNSLYKNTTADNNIGIGINSIYNNTTGESNIGIGRNTIYNSTSSSENIALGNFALENITNNSFGNIGIGIGSLNTLNGVNNVSIGAQSSINIEGDYNVAIGYNNLTSNNNNYNIGIGNNLLSVNNGIANIAIGNSVLGDNDTGEYNIGLGYNSLKLNTSGQNNISLGAQALQNNTSSSFNIAIGSNSLSHNTIKGSNISIGYGSMTNYDGSNSGSALTNNIAIGKLSLAGNAGTIADNEGRENIAIGTSTLIDNKRGSKNIAIGENALNNNVNGDKNIAIGEQAGYSNIDGTTNIYLGVSANSPNTSISGSSAIGYQAYVSKNNTIVLGSIPSVNGSVIQTQVSIGNTTPHNSAILELNSLELGFLPTRATTADVTAITSPADGLISYATDKYKSLSIYTNTASSPQWRKIAYLKNMSIITNNITLNETHDILLLNSTGGTYTVYIPAGSTLPYKEYTFRVLDRTNQVVVDFGTNGGTFENVYNSFSTTLGVDVIKTKSFLTIKNIGTNVWYAISN